MIERQNYEIMGEVYRYGEEALRKYYHDTERHKEEFAQTLSLMRGKLTEREKQAIDYFLRGTRYDYTRRD